MAQQVVNIGSVANDGTGDPVRTAFDKVNDNFSELYFDRGFVTPSESVEGGVADATAALAAAVATGACFLPANTRWLTTAPVAVPSGGILMGAGRSSCIVGDEVTGGVVELGAGGSVGDHADAIVLDIGIDGSGDYAMKTDTAIKATIEGIYGDYVTAEFADGFSFDLLFSSTLRRIFTDGADIPGKGFIFGNLFNNNLVELLVTSNYGTHNFYCELGAGSHGSVFNALCAQGGDIGLHVGDSFNAGTFNGFYSENVVKPIVLGDTNKRCVGLTFNSPTIGGPYEIHPNYADRVALIDFRDADGVTFNSPHLSGSYGVKDVAPLVISGSGGGSGAVGIARVSPTGVITSVLLLAGGASYSGTITVAVGGVGTGENVTATQSGGVINALTLVDGGTGFVDAPPMPIIYTKAARCVFNGAWFNAGTGNKSRHLWPWVVRSAGAGSDGGIEINGDFAYDNDDQLNATASLQKLQGFGYKHGVFYRDANRAEVSLDYVPAAFP